MEIEFTINNSNDKSARYLTWTPSPLRLRLLGAPPGSADVEVTITEKRKANGGSLRFSLLRDSQFHPQIKIKLPTDGQSVTVFLCGLYGAPSKEDGDVSIAVIAQTMQEIGILPVMVRIRKNANSLSIDERDRFLSAMAMLNNRGTGRFADFRSMHMDTAALDQAHGGPGFLPWHRSYLLDLERELQAIDSTVTLPYWRFDMPAPNVFTKEFMGVADSLGDVQFVASHPFKYWYTDGQQGIIRRSSGPDPAMTTSPLIRKEVDTIALGPRFGMFTSMEGNPHGRAHTSYFGGSISDPGTAPKDPLFFLLHCNVDRLWAKWQHQLSRFDASVAAAYVSDTVAKNFVEGHKLKDSLWPWNGKTAPPRPNTAPGGEMARSACVLAPGARPNVIDMLDYQGVVDHAKNLGFAYDDVAFV